MKVTEKICLKIREDVQTTPIEVTTSSSDVADEEQFFFAQTHGEDETEEQTLEMKGQSRKKATEWVAHEEPSSIKPSIKEFTKVDGNSTSYSEHGIKANARIRVEDVALVLKNLKLKILGQLYDEVLLTTDKRFKYYYQLLIPEQLVHEVLRSLHGKFAKHLRITKTIIAYRQKFYNPNMAKLIRQGVTSCDQCNRESRVDDKLTRPALQNPGEHIAASDDAMRINLFPELPRSGDAENIVTAMDFYLPTLPPAKLQKR